MLETASVPITIRQLAAGKFEISIFRSRLIIIFDIYFTIRSLIFLRILEMEQDFKINNRLEKAEIELWDCSGDLKYDSSWPALSDGSNGVVFVLNPNEPSHAKELNQWFTHFVKDAGLREEVCLVISNRFTTDDGTTGKGETKLCKDISSL